jgi:C-methyltransferase C-terminal domain/Methyltransferase domain/Putative zinc binding domain
MNFETTSYTAIEKCRICGNSNLIEVLNLGLQALTGVFPKGSDEIVPCGPLELVKCMPSDERTACGLVQLRHSFVATQMYGDNYGYRSGLNPTMVAHLRQKAQQIKDAIALRPGDLVLDIGSNDSTFLQALFEPGITAVGMDPTGKKFFRYYPNHINLIPDFFSAIRFFEEYSQRRAKVITSFAMFYDLEDPLEFMRQITRVLADDGIWVLEQSYLPLMLEQNAYDTVCHEHLEYYALSQLSFMAEAVGLTVLDATLNDVNGGSFSVTLGKRGSSHMTNPKAVKSIQEREADLKLDDLKIFREFAVRVQSHRTELLNYFSSARRSGLKVYGYGASTKGNVLLQYCGITHNHLNCILEINEDKFGAFTPGTKIPIVAEDVLQKHPPDVVLVLPWHFREHILNRLQPFISSGRSVVFPLPHFEVIRNAKSISHR